MKHVSQYHGIIQHSITLESPALSLASFCFFLPVRIKKSYVFNLQLNKPPDYSLKP